MVNILLAPSSAIYEQFHKKKTGDNINSMSSLLVNIAGYLYKNIVKKFLFLFDPESVHLKTISFGERLGKSTLAKKTITPFFRVRHASLRQNIFGIEFQNPLGLAAGFDYEARLTQILPSLGFGFGTVGTLTRHAYGGNPRPMLGRLPKSQSLMVNKGFRNLGIAATLKRLEEKKFAYPVGVSIGKTNTPHHKTQQEAVADIVSAFKIAEAAQVPFSYYELNISCPNLTGSVEFYAPRHLRELLKELAGLNVSKPVFIKMPISKTDGEIRLMMDEIVRYPYIKAVILGNLQRDRKDPALIQEEVGHFPVGNFSGRPCREKSDELIKLAFREYGSAIKIIGCGGVFSAEDAYRKIKLGASLVQLITGLVFEGPQLVSRINRDLVGFLKRDGYSSIADAVGTEA